MIYPYKKGSKSAKALSEAMETKIISLNNSKFLGNENKVIINWGASKMSEEASKCTIINKPEAVKIAGNKRLFFEAAEGKVSIPEFTADIEVAKEWLEDEETVVGRTTLTGHSGEGITILEEPMALEFADEGAIKLFVKYKKKKDEYRVHVVGGEVVDVRRKALRPEVVPAKANWKVRNLQGGFIYAKEGFEVDQQVIEEALKAIEVVGLDFGAVDVIWNTFRKKAWVLEINTAPGLEGSTVDSYAAGFKKLLMDEQKEFVGKKFSGRTPMYSLDDLIMKGPEKIQFVDDSGDPPDFF